MWRVAQALRYFHRCAYTHRCMRVCELWALDIQGLCVRVTSCRNRLHFFAMRANRVWWLMRIKGTNRLLSIMKNYRLACNDWFSGHCRFSASSFAYTSKGNCTIRGKSYICIRNTLYITEMLMMCVHDQSLIAYFRYLEYIIVSINILFFILYWNWTFL